MLVQLLLLPFKILKWAVIVGFHMVKICFDILFWCLSSVARIVGGNFSPAPKRFSGGMDGYKYEHYVAKYLNQHGYHRVCVTKASGDYGVDVLAFRGPNKYAVQCKYYSNPVGIAAVQEAVAGMAIYHCDRAMVVTNSTFTAQARNLAAANHVTLLEHIGT